MHIKQGDTVMVITGKDKGKKGKVLSVDNKKERVYVEGVNMVTKHQKPNPRMQTGGIIQQEAGIHVSNLMIWDEKSKAPSRIRTIRKQGKKDKKVMKYRVAVKSGEVLD